MMLADAKLEVECAKLEAEKIRRENDMRVQNAAEKENRILARAKEMSERILRSTFDDLKTVEKQLKSTVERYTELYQYLEGDEEKRAEKIGSFLEGTDKENNTGN